MEPHFISVAAVNRPLTLPDAASSPDPCIVVDCGLLTQGLTYPRCGVQLWFTKAFSKHMLHRIWK